MVMTINTNVPSLMAQKQLGKTQDQLAQTLRRLSSGQRVNNAKDDAAGLAIAEGMKAQIRGYRQGVRNGNDGISMIQAAESGMNQTLGLVQRMRELSVQASTETYSSSDLSNLNTEYQSLLSEVGRVNSTTQFNGISLLTGGSKNIQVGAKNSSNNSLSVTLTATDATSLTINGTDITNRTNALASMAALDTAITTLTTGLSGLGAAHSNIESAVQGSETNAIMLESATSQIMDADFASESAKMSQLQILQQAGTAMLAQANSSAQVVMKLIQG